MPPVKEGEAGMEPDTQLKRARLSFIGQKPVQHRPSSWNGFSYLEKACSNKSKFEQEDERSSPPSNEDENISSPLSRPTRRKLADGTVHEEEEEEVEAMDMKMEMEDPMQGHSPDTPPHFPDRTPKQHPLSLAKRSPCSSPSLSTCEMPDVEHLPPLASGPSAEKSGEPGGARKTAMPLPQGGQGPMLVKSDGKAIPLTPQVLEKLASMHAGSAMSAMSALAGGSSSSSSQLASSAPADMSGEEMLAEKRGAKRTMSGALAARGPLHSPGTPTVAIDRKSVV